MGLISSVLFLAGLARSGEVAEECRALPGGPACPPSALAMFGPQQALGMIVCDVEGSVQWGSVDVAANGLAWAGVDGVSDYAEWVGEDQWGVLYPVGVLTGDLSCTGLDGEGMGHSQAEVNLFGGDIEVAVAACGHGFAHSTAEIAFTATTPWSLDCIVYYEPAVDLPVVPGLQRTTTSFDGGPPIIIENDDGAVSSNEFLQTGLTVWGTSVQEENYYVLFETSGGTGPQAITIETAIATWGDLDRTGEGHFTQQDVDIQDAAGVGAFDYTGDAVVDDHDAMVVRTLFDARTGTPAGCVDLDGSGVVDVVDLLLVIQFWGVVGSGFDLNDDGQVNVTDLLQVINAWGTSPVCEF